MIKVFACHENTNFQNNYFTSKKITKLRNFYFKNCLLKIVAKKVP